MDNIAQLISKEGRAENPYAAYFMLGCMAYGSLKIASKAISILLFTYRHALKGVPNLFEKYADPSKKPWAVVSGGSDGIGE